MRKIFIVFAHLLLLQPIAWSSAPEKDYESYLRKTNVELQAWSAKVSELQKRTESAGAKTRTQMDQQLKVAHKELDVAKRKLKQFEGSSKDSWENMRRSMDDTLRKIKAACEKAASYFNTSEHAKEGKP